MAFGDIVRKAKGYARQNPDKTKQMLDKIESTVDQKTQGKYRDKVSKAGNAVGGALGVERDGQQGQQGQVPGQGQPGQAQPGQGQPGQGQPGQVSGQEVPGQGQRQHGQAPASGQEVPSPEQQQAHRGQDPVSGQEVPGHGHTRSEQAPVSGQEVPGKNQQGQGPTTQG